MVTWEEEKRSNPRVDIGPSRRPKMILSDGRMNVIPINLLNLSRSGAGFLCRKDLLDGDELVVMLSLPDSSVRIITSGIIRHKQSFVGLYGYGLEFSLDEQESQEIAKYINYLILAFRRS